MPDTISQIYIADTKGRAVFSEKGPQPQFLLDSPTLITVVVGLEAGARIPVHADSATCYHFLEGEGLMTVGEEDFAIKPGVTVIVPAGKAA
jgi:mannose-6-phosphate isomerase-like protein (cupin superfamily)